MTQPTKSSKPPSEDRWRPILGAVLNFALGLGGLLGTGFLVVKQWKRAMVSLAIGFLVVSAWVALFVNPAKHAGGALIGEVTGVLFIVLIGTPVYIVIWVFSIVLVLQGLYPDDESTDGVKDHADAPD